VGVQTLVDSSACCRAAEVIAERKRREIYARNAVMKQWVQRNMEVFQKQMLLDAAGPSSEMEGFGV
jgi:hypothetical protein